MSVGRYWLLTIPHYVFTPFLPQGVAYIRGQLEQGAGGFLHWQVLAVFDRNVRLAGVRKVFGDVHAELSRSSAADDYVWKEDTRVPNTQFELGRRAVRRNCKRDWAEVWESAVAGSIMEIDPAIRVQHYRTLRTIGSDHCKTMPMERRVHVFWGRSGTGKSRRAWDEAGFDAYSKDPRTKFWDGYSGQEKVVIDEFRGGIDVAHILRWCDRYPVRVEIKGASVPFAATEIWITSNVDPRNWYPDLDADTKEALLRRLEIVHFNGNPFIGNNAQ